MPNLNDSLESAMNTDRSTQEIIAWYEADTIFSAESFVPNALTFVPVCGIIIIRSDLYEEKKYNQSHSFFC